MMDGDKETNIDVSVGTSGDSHVLVTLYKDEQPYLTLRMHNFMARRIALQLWLCSDLTETPHTDCGTS